MKIARKFSFQYDFAVIGAGPGGYVAAIKAAQLGLKTICIDKRPSLGGCCLNDGCIPSKTLLNSSYKFWEASKKYKRHGVQFSNLSLNFEQMMQNKIEVSDSMTRGVQGLFNKNRVNHIKGEAKLLNQNTLLVENQEITSKYIIIATGSQPKNLPGQILPIDEKRVLSSTGGMNLQEVPQSLAIIGGGPVGLEIGSIYNRLGSKITIIETSNRIAPGLDFQIAQQLKQSLQKQGINFMMKTKITDGQKHQNSVKIDTENSSLQAQYALIGVGRQAYTENLNLKSMQIQTDQDGKIIVNQRLQIPNYQNIYAIGDCISGAMLAHKAEAQGVFVAQHLATGGGQLNYEAISSIIYTMPQTAQVGLTQQKLKQENIPYKKSVFPFMANSRARANHDTEGLIKVLAQEHSNRLLGCHILGSTASELIAEAVLGITYQASCEDLARSCHAHPCYSEGFKEACLATFAKNINF